MHKSIMIIAMLLTSCVGNPYEQFYQGAADARTIPAYEPILAELRIHGTDDLDRDIFELRRNGYEIVGQSHFNAGTNSYNEAKLRAQANKIGAHVVLVASEYTHTVSGVAPLSIPNTTTSYSTGTANVYGSGGSATVYGTSTTTTHSTQSVVVPYSVARSDYTTIYFAKLKSRLGIYPERVSDEMRQRIQTNAGISVQVVSEDSTAFDADVLTGDIVLSIGEDPIRSVEQFYLLLDKYEGQTPIFKIIRNDTTLEKEIEIRSY